MLRHAPPGVEVIGAHPLFGPDPDTLEGRNVVLVPSDRSGQWLPIMAGLFAHEAVGHLSEADFIAEKPAARAVMTPGRPFGPRNPNIYDAGAGPRLRGGVAFDREGVARPTALTLLRGCVVDDLPRIAVFLMNASLLGLQAEL